MTKTKYKRCPFCGYDPKKTEHEKDNWETVFSSTVGCVVRWARTCFCCRAATGFYKSKSAATRAWNRRVP